jgi:membrane protein required for colicin V production
MQTYDFIMLAVLILATLFGAWKGMAWQLASIASLVLSYAVALRYSTRLAPMFGDSQPWNRFLAMLVIYVATSLVVWVLFRFVADLIDRVKLKEFDRQLGATFGLAKGVLLCVAITLFAVAMLPDQQKESILSSRSGYYIGVLLDRSHTVLPEELHDILHPYIHGIDERLNAEGRLGSPRPHTADEEPAEPERTALQRGGRPS